MADVTPTAIIPVRSINGTILPDVIVEEQHQDQLVITDHPVEQGAVISDHAYKLPAELLITYGFWPGSDQNAAMDPSYLNTVYSKALELQTTRTLFSVTTKRRVYQNMLMASVHLTTDKNTENSLILRMVCREVIIASTKTITVSVATVKSIQKQFESTLPKLKQGVRNLTDGLRFDPGSVLKKYKVF